MFIEKLYLKFYRNIEEIEFYPDKKLNIFYGRNAQGKTNIIESIYLMAYLKSFKSTKNEEIIKHNKNQCLIKLMVNKNNVSTKLALNITNKTKIVSIENKKPKTFNEYFGFLRPILFSPEDILMAKGFPSGKRNLIDRAIFQFSHFYFDKLYKYNRCLKQRNKMLKEKHFYDDLKPWNDGLILYGTNIRSDRNKFLKRFLPIFKNVFYKITDGLETADIIYNYLDESDENLKYFFEKDLYKTKEREIILGQTLIGPHRDDFSFLINGKPIREYASQGQQRSFILAFKIAQILDLENFFGESPIFLLDDLTGELDIFRQRYFIDFIKNCKCQVFITTTEIESLLKAGISNGHFYEVQQGTVNKFALNEELI